MSMKHGVCVGAFVVCEGNKGVLGPGDISDAIGEALWCPDSRCGDTDYWLPNRDYGSYFEAADALFSGASGAIEIPEMRVDQQIASFNFTFGDAVRFLDHHYETVRVSFGVVSYYN